MVDNIQICRVTEADYDDVISIRDDVYDGLDYLPYLFKEWLPTHEGYLARINGLPVAFRFLVFLDDGKSFCFRSGRVRREYEGKGIFRKLSEYIIKTVNIRPGLLKQLSGFPERGPVNKIQTGEYTLTVQRMVDNIQICRVTEADYDDVISIRDDVYDGLDYLPYLFKEWLPTHEGYLARINGLPVAFRFLVFLDDGKSFCFRSGRVRREYEGKGIFRKLSEYIIKTVNIRPGLLKQLSGFPERGPVNKIQTGEYTLTVQRMVDNIQICRVTEADYDDVISIRDDVYDGLDYLPYLFKEWLPTHEGYLARINGLPVAFRFLVFLDDGKSFCFRSGRVRREYEGKGIFRKLSEYIIKTVNIRPGWLKQLSGFPERGPVNKIQTGEYTLTVQRDLLAYRQTRERALESVGILSDNYSYQSEKTVKRNNSVIVSRSGCQRSRQLSVATDIESLRYPSWCLCRLLDRIIGTKDEVALRRRAATLHQYTYENYMPRKVLHSGSRGEGFNFRSSDVDLMYIDKNVAVLESMQNLRPDDEKKTVLLLERNGCNPGFAILQLVNGTNDWYIRESVVEYHSHPVVSSLQFRDAHKLAEYGDIGHGPCNTTKIYFRDLDTAHCFKCDKWPTEAQEFIHRQRPHGWPPECLLGKIISRGCHLVPIGDRDSRLSYIQWRLSFSAAEKDLVHSFNHVQFLVYGLMKIFLTQFINQCLFVNDILCSYFLKTAMFYCIEGTPSSFWRDDTLIPCFWFCLNKLIHWVEQGYCPNYFVPQNNMFRGKVFGKNKRNLITVLNQCKHLGWTCVHLCEDLQSLEHFLNQPESLYSTGVIPNEKKRECDSDFIVHIALARQNALDVQHILRHLRGPLTLLRYARTQIEEDISMLQLYSALRHTGQIYACINVGINNKSNYRKSYHRLLMSATSNIYTGAVYLATFYYLKGQCKKAVYVCNRVISQWKSYVMYHSTANNTIYITDMYERYVCGRDVSVLDKAKSAFAFDILLDSQRKDYFPKELFRDIEASDPLFVLMPPIPYTVFLLFLCHHKLGNIDDSVTALHDLQALLDDEQQGCRGYPIVLNMLAVCQDKLGDVQGAIETCLLSQALKPDRNGAVKMLEKLLGEYP